MDWSSWLALVGVSIAAGLALFGVVAGYYHVRYYRLRRGEPEAWKCQPKRFLRPAMERQAALLSASALTLGGVVSGTLIFGLMNGLPSPIYYDVGDYGWAWTLGSTALLFVLVDGIAYYVHRFLHTRAMYRRFHRWHHRYVATSPWVVTAVHPVELLMLQGATFLPLFLIPFHYVSIIAVFVYVLVFNVVDHSGVDLRSRLPWQPPSRFHDDHHVYVHVNFGQHLMLWDRLHGTLRRADRRYGEHVFGGKGESTEEAGGASGAVHY